MYKYHWKTFPTVFLLRSKKIYLTLNLKVFTWSDWQRSKCLLLSWVPRANLLVNAHQKFCTSVKFLKIIFRSKSFPWQLQTSKLKLQFEACIQFHSFNSRMIQRWKLMTWNALSLLQMTAWKLTLNSRFIGRCRKFSQI